MNHQALARSTNHPAASPTEPRPVLAALVGALRPRRETITRVLNGLGDGLVVLSLPARTPRQDIRATYDVLGECLTSGRSVLVNAANKAKADRRALLDIADRHWAQTLAVVCPSAGTAGTQITLIASLPGEGWKGVVVAR